MVASVPGAGLNYNLRPTVILKGEYKRVDNTEGYSGVFVVTPQQRADQIFSGAPAHNFDADIISIGVDFVF